MILNTGSLMVQIMVYIFSKIASASHWLIYTEYIYIYICVYHEISSGMRLPSIVRSQDVRHIEFCMGSNCIKDFFELVPELWCPHATLSSYIGWDLIVKKNVWCGLQFGLMPPRHWNLKLEGMQVGLAASTGCFNQVRFTNQSRSTAALKELAVVIMQY